MWTWFFVAINYSQKDSSEMFELEVLVLLSRRHLSTMLLTNFENLNSISNIFQEVHDFLVLTDPLIMCIYSRTTDRHFRDQENVRHPTSNLLKCDLIKTLNTLWNPSLRIFAAGKASLCLFTNFHHMSSNIVHGQIHVTLCLTYLLNNKNYNSFLTIRFYRICPKQVLKTNEPSLFPLHRSQSNHHKQSFSITTSKISYHLIKPQVLLCVPTCGCKFHAYVVNLHLTFKASSQSELCLSTPHL